MSIFDELNKDQEKLEPAIKTIDVSEQTVLISGVFVDKFPEFFLSDIINSLNRFTMIDVFTHQGIKRIDSQALNYNLKKHRMFNDWIKLRYSIQNIQDYDRKIIFCFNSDDSIAEYLNSRKFHVCMFGKENFLEELEEYVRGTKR